MLESHTMQNSHKLTLSELSKLLNSQDVPGSHQLSNPENSHKLSPPQNSPNKTPVMRQGILSFEPLLYIVAKQQRSRRSICFLADARLPYNGQKPCLDLGGGVVGAASKMSRLDFGGGVVGTTGPRSHLQSLAACCKADASLPTR